MDDNYLNLIKSGLMYGPGSSEEIEVFVFPESLDKTFTEASEYIEGLNQPSKENSLEEGGIESAAGVLG